MKTDREICAAATDGPWRVLAEKHFSIWAPKVHQWVIARYKDISKEDAAYIAHFDPHYQMQILDRQEQLESKLKEASEFIQKLGPTIDYDIVAEIEEVLR